MTNGDGYKCPNCPRKFKTQQGLKVHFKRKHEPKSPPPKGFRKSKKDDE